MSKRKYYDSYDFENMEVNNSEIKADDFSIAEIINNCDNCENLNNTIVLKHYDHHTKKVWSYCEVCENGGAYDIGKDMEYQQWLQFMGLPKLNS
tara:strand:+ start:523 stop:804 length:282 start_codon:yes stop_codon:yes gene_type:complete